jgi:putative FmdB family regulatory protein
MPTYEYRCERGHNFEEMQRMADDPLTECKICGAPVQRVFHPVAVHFKGSGFYTTDYGKKKTAGATDSKSDSSSSSSSDSKESKDSKKKDSKSSDSGSSKSSSSSSSSD